MATEIINANSLQLYLGTDGTRASTTSGADGERLPLANTTSVTLEINTDMLDTTNKDSNRWKTITPGLRSWSVSAEGQLDNLAELSTTFRTAVTTGQLAANGTKVYIELGVDNARWVGCGYITSFPVTGGTNDIGTFTLSIDGDDALNFDADVTA